MEKLSHGMKLVKYFLLLLGNHHTQDIMLPSQKLTFEICSTTFRNFLKILSHEFFTSMLDKDVLRDRLIDWFLNIRYADASSTSTVFVLLDSIIA